MWVLKEGCRWYEGWRDSNGCLQRRHFLFVYRHQIALVSILKTRVGWDGSLGPGLAPRFGRICLASCGSGILATSLLGGTTKRRRRMQSFEGLPTELLLLSVICQEEKIEKVMGLLAMLDSGLEVALPNVGGPVDHLRVRETGGFAKGLNLILVWKWMRLRED